MTAAVLCRREEYFPSSFFIDFVDLTLDLYEESTVVTAKLSIRANQDRREADLVLHGENQKLVSVKLNQQLQEASRYRCDENKLTIFDVPDEFELEISSVIQPQKNTELMGLYKTEGLFCTQCEAEGFRRIIYYLDRPDVMSIFKTKIVANKKAYPVLLSNGNLVASGDVGLDRHFVVWHDPFKKPAYLFAMIAGDLAKISDTFTTKSGRKVQLEIYAAHSVIHQCSYAMSSLKKAMRFDEEEYGREYDLDIFMIVAVQDFNFGAMENKGLNIFNDKYILVDPNTATDEDYAGVDAVVAHEYFHNWSGNRVTLRDWFQLSLKEGFTVLREQSFTEAIGQADVDRIHQVRHLRNLQFPEDAGPLAHPVRPDSYLEINNFYTMTIYEKGAEVVRMLRTLLGKKQFREGTDLYFEKNDGKAVTCDNFVSAMEEVSGLDLTQFKFWYSQSGTPILNVSSSYDVSEKILKLTVKQLEPIGVVRQEFKPMCLPFSVGLIDALGNDLPGSSVLKVEKSEETFVFESVEEKPVLSLLRGFSAPVVVNYEYTDDELVFLMLNDSDSVASWEASQSLSTRVMLKMMDDYRNQKPLSSPGQLINAFCALLKKENRSQALISEMLFLPSELSLCEKIVEIDPESIITVKKFVEASIAEHLQDDILKNYKRLSLEKEYRYDSVSVANRSLKNRFLYYLALLPDQDEFLYQQFQGANNMTDQYTALSLLADTESEYRDKALSFFYDRWQTDHLVIDKWFSAQAASKRANVFLDVQALVQHPAYTLRNPNKVRAVLGQFARNFSGLHQEGVSAYEWLVREVNKIDHLNPMVAARLVQPLADWHRFKKPYQDHMRNSLVWLKQQKISVNLSEIVDKMLVV